MGLYRDKGDFRFGLGAVHSDLVWKHSGSLQQAAGRPVRGAALQNHLNPIYFIYLIYPICLPIVLIYPIHLPIVVIYPIYLPIVLIYPIYLPIVVIYPIYLPIVLIYPIYLPIVVIYPVYLPIVLIYPIYLPIVVTYFIANASLWRGPEFDDIFEAVGL